MPTADEVLHDTLENFPHADATEIACKLATRCAAAESRLAEEREKHRLTNMNLDDTREFLAEVEREHAEKERLFHLANGRILDLERERDALRAEVEALRADRERLDWWAERHGVIDRGCFHTVKCDPGQDIRAALDAARAAEADRDA